MDELWCFLVFLALFFVAANPWILIPLGILAVIVIVYAIKNPSNGGGSGSYTGYSSYSTHDEHRTSTIAPGSDGHIWRGRFKGDYDPVVATYRNGRIFDGYNSGLQDFYSIRASYKNGYVYDGSMTDWSGTVLGRYERGYIYRGNSTFFSDCIGRYEDGKIYSGNSTSFSSNIIGTYEGNGDGAAAAAVVYLLN